MTETPTGPNTSPLAEAEVGSIDELFARIDTKLATGMPETISDEADLRPIVEFLRAQRENFLKVQNETGKAPRAPRKAKPKSVAEAVVLDESDF